jgi:hypothetical protein
MSNDEMARHRCPPPNTILVVGKHRFPMRARVRARDQSRVMRASLTCAIEIVVFTMKELPGPPPGTPVPTTPVPPSSEVSGRTAGDQPEMARDLASAERGGDGRLGGGRRLRPGRRRTRRHCLDRLVPNPLLDHREGDPSRAAWVCRRSWKRGSWPSRAPAGPWRRTSSNAA